VFGLLALAGFAYAPQPADLPDQKMWRIHRTADHGAFQDAARDRGCDAGTARVRQGVFGSGVFAGLSFAVPANSVCESAPRSRSFSSLSLSLSRW
jgi:hypothetical protein